MTAYDPQIIAKRLSHLEEIIAKLEKERPHTAAELTARDTLSDATLYRIQTGIEVVVDIGSHILTELHHQRPDTYKDTLKAMGTAGIVSSDLVEENLVMVDFRNILVHHYVALDPQKALLNIEKSPRVFRQFAEQIAVYLETLEG